MGRILADLKRRRRLVEPTGRAVSAKRRRVRRPYSTRKTKDYVPHQSGDLVQVDTLELSPLPGVTVMQFTARDMVSCWDVMEVFLRPMALCAQRFLDTLEARTPFPLRAVHVDGGSEFRAEFETECADRKILLFELPSRSPKLNGRVERAQRTHTEEFYEVYELPWTVASLNVRLREWEQVYNHIRPHQALDYLTPAQALETFKKKAPVSHMS